MRDRHRALYKLAAHLQSAPDLEGHLHRLLDAALQACDAPRRVSGLEVVAVVLLWCRFGGVLLVCFGLSGGVFSFCVFCVLVCAGGLLCLCVWRFGGSLEPSLDVF